MTPPTGTDGSDGGEVGPVSEPVLSEVFVLVFVFVEVTLIFGADVGAEGDRLNVCSHADTLIAQTSIEINLVN
jgi:hypothetical protein